MFRYLAHQGIHGKDNSKLHPHHLEKLGLRLASNYAIPLSKLNQKLRGCLVKFYLHGIKINSDDKKIIDNHDMKIYSQNL